jgi:acyl-CoA synthetase (AMP-forming)/AMP-acid ligase II
MTSAGAIHEMIAETSRSLAGAAALAGVDRPPLTYAGLVEQIERTVGALNRLGVGRGDTVAMVVPNGPEMAAAFVGVAAAATTAPLNPQYKREEFEFYLSDLKAGALLIADGMCSPARDVARERGIPVIALHPAPGTAGRFTLEGTPGRRPSRPGVAGGDDVALVLHTSGTTSRPKVVPLSHRNLTTSATNIRRSLSLSAEDRCLNVMPLFHIHGLAAAVLATLSSGGSVFCTPGFDALKFFGWMRDVQPTWYSAVPTMHQTIVARSQRNRDVVTGSRLRFVRSSSAALPPRLMDALERVFDCPAIEAYGMTEAAHQMASNPLPPSPRKPGSVGIAAGPELAVMSEDGRLLPTGHGGEIVIRGDNVTGGYVANPEANAGAFVDGWFRTGDCGHFDDDGYLRLTGRLKEIINRGGEKISPREVDEVLLDHPAVDQAVAFALPHPVLGEDVGAVVVLRDGADASEQSLRSHVASRLSDFKVPRRVVFVADIPKGPTGKLQRIGLADKLGLT